MKGKFLREARKNKGWTQEAAASHLGVSQAYLSLLERDHREVPKRRANAFFHALGPLPPDALSWRGAENWNQVNSGTLAAEVAGLGYPGFSYMRTQATWNPSELLVAALTKDELESRVTESLPWLVLSHEGLDWEVVVREAKVNDVQNRLGFVVTLARRLAETKGNTSRAHQLSEVESRLQSSVLARQQTLCHEQMTEAERRWLQERSTPEARHWNVLSDLAPEHLTHAA